MSDMERGTSPNQELADYYSAQAATDQAFSEVESGDKGDSSQLAAAQLNEIQQGLRVAIPILASLVEKLDAPSSDSNSSSANDARIVGLGMSTSKVARRLGVSAISVRRWADAGDIAASQTPGGHRRFSEHDVEDFRKRISRHEASND